MAKKLVFVVSEKCLDAGEKSSMKAELLSHPRTNEKVLFMFNGKKTKVFEVTKYSNANRSWINGNEVISGGDLHVVTPFDPLFLLLPHLVKNVKFFAPLDQTVKDLDCPAVSWLVNCVGPTDLEKICDYKKAGSQEVFRYNEDKTLSWLESKARRVQAGLKEKNLLACQSVHFVRASRDGDSESDDDRYLSEAVGIIGDYLQPDFLTKLKDHLGIKAPPPPAKLDEAENVEPSTKKARHSDAPSEDYSLGFKVEKGKEVKQTAAQKKLAQAAKGTMSIASFFGKPKVK